ncbi:hypothetical protein [Lactobacillus psittaci]|uniref:Adhesin n=1 Tax=Lactobacillus psittaci DSM 15354 TaxID=1122152 RepID=A0A0R1S4S4_9LACO|nr:hypothetical protein [Lactobacillus psittaci]KRL64045.1 hypothetical protein FC23_GL000293 [Lactobacillus psittaci DSM 15354]
MKKKSYKIIGLSLLALSLAGEGAALASQTVAAASTPPAMPKGSAKQGKGGANTQSYDYTGSLSATILASSKSRELLNKTYSSTSKDKNVALVKNAGSLTLNHVTLSKTGSSSNDDNNNFYGTNSVLLATGKKSTAYIKNSKIKSNAKGANGIFASNKATVYTNNTSITTTGSANSRGLDATYGGTIIANKTNISTKGDHSAAIATDRGGGNVSVTNSKLKTAGSGSPLIYSTGNIEVNNVTGTASGSQIAGMEGYNNIYISNSKLVSTNNNKTGSDPIKNGVILYQSMSGDADTATSKAAKFQAVNSSLSTSIDSGAMFYVTNTSANVVLKNTKLNFNSKKVNLLTIAGNNSNSWGSAGSNGAKVTFTGIKQKLNGNIAVDNISSLKLYLLKNSTYTGKTTITSNSKATSSSKTKAPITINIAKGSKWVVTGNSTVSNLNVEAGAKIVDKSGKTVTIVNSAGKTLVKGSSKYKITVKGSYSKKVTTSSANKLSKSTISRTAFDKYFDTNTKFSY